MSLVDKGVRVKATGFGRVELDVAKRPYDHSDIELICNILDEDQAEKVLYKNAIEWYMK